MGKKSRRQREPGGAAAGFLKPHKRFEKDHWRHKDGSPVTDEENLKLYLALRTAPQLKEVREMQGKGLTKDETEQQRQEYMALVIYRKITTKGMLNAIDALSRWPRVQPHWSRVRRRICDQCGRQVALSEPRFMVCGGCGVARYCSEACQIANWGHHQTVCAALARQAARDGKTSATAKAAPFKARGVLNTLNSPFVHVDDF